MLIVKKVKSVMRESGSLGFLILNLKSHLLTLIENRSLKEASSTQTGHARLPDSNKIVYQWKYRHEIDFIINEIYHLGVYHRFSCPVKGQTIIDVGSHIGIYTLNAARKVGASGKVITVEPSPDNYQTLTKNIMMNHLDNVIPVNAALASTEGNGKLFLSDSGKHSLVPTNRSEYIETGLTTLDKLTEKLGLTGIDTVKIDVEGAEIEVLKGSTDALKSKIKRLVIAAYHYPSEAQDITNFLKQVAPHLKVELKPSHEGQDNDIYLYAGWR